MAPATIAPAIAAAPPGPELVEAKAEPPPVSTDGELTDGQKQWLVTLEELGLRSAFDALPPERRVYMLGAFRLGYEPFFGKEFVKELRPKVSDTPPPPAMPPTVDEMLEKLPDGPQEWTQHVANDLVREFGTPKDHELWPAFHDLAMCVWRREIPTEVVLDALRESRNSQWENQGAGFNHALKKRGVTWGGSRP
jgi:hypothetical protein